VLSFELRVQR